jgi:multicomponent Na+:H+ antiporter subunit C
VTALAYLVAAWLLLAGVLGMVRSQHLVQAIVSLSVAQSGTYVLLLAVGFQRDAAPPVFGAPGLHPSRRVVDPLVQAMTLTDIVVSATVTALLLAITMLLAKRQGTVDPDELNETRG